MDNSLEWYKEKKKAKNYQSSNQIVSLYPNIAVKVIHGTRFLLFHL